MPLRTPYYKIEMFGWEDIYSASSDKRRFTTIDNQMAFISSIIGNGRIYGWNIEKVDVGNREVAITPGMGLINNRVLQSYGKFKFTLDNNETKYIFIKEKNGGVGGFGGVSDIVYVEASDSVPPAKPSGLQTSSKTDTQISLTWNENSEKDFSHYVVYRSNDIEYGDFVEIGTSSSPLYLDTGLEQNTTYAYSVKAVDYSGNESLSAEIESFTDMDISQPLPPTYIQLLPSTNTLQVIWDYSVSSNVVSYKIVVQPLNNNYENNGNSFELTVDANNSLFNFGSDYKIIDNLTNNVNYKISIYSVSYNNVLSEEIYDISKPYDTDDTGSIYNINIDFEESQFDNIKIETNINWSFQEELDPYLDIVPEEFLITFIENGNRVSEDISVLYHGKSVDYSKKIKLIPYKNANNVIEYETIKEYTPYLIIIKTKYDNGSIGTGFLTRVNRTPAYDLVSQVTGLSYQHNQDNSIRLYWENPYTNYLDFLKLTITITNVTNNDTIDYLTDINIGQTSSYSIPSSMFDIDYRYTVKVTPVDVFERDGDSNQIVFQVENSNSERPSDIGGLFSTTSDREIDLFWDKVENEGIQNYKIYRALYTLFIDYEDYEEISTISSDKNYFIDYDVKNGTTYSYFVTSVNIYGEESLNPSDEYVPPTFVTATPVASSILDTVENLTVVDIGNFDAQLSWQGSSGSFDGYEIFRSIGDKSNFKLVGYAYSSDTTYIDTDVLLSDSVKYYYLVRKYKNEITYATSDSIVPVSNSILIGSVTAYTEEGSQSLGVDNSLATELKDYEDPLREKAQNAIALHKHDISNGNDKRIELKSNVSISDWSTTDFQNYYTEEDIDGSSNYVLRIAGELNEDYFKLNNGKVDAIALKTAQLGVCPVKYYVNTADKSVFFYKPLYTLCEEPDADPLNPDAEPICPVTPYSTEPVITLDLIDVSEIEGNLTNDKIESLNATQFSSGKINKNQIPAIYHEGRISETLMPIKLSTETIDYAVYSLANLYEDEDRNKVGTSVTFYDIIKISDNTLLSATSSGIWLSNDLGNSWESKENFNIAAKRVFKASTGYIYAITNYNVYVSEGNLSRWDAMSGLESVKIIRDIVEDSFQNLYVTTDLGIYRLNKNKPYIEDTWEQLTILGPRSAESYGILLDDRVLSDPLVTEENIISSNELAILKSSNSGNSWEYVSDFSETIKIQKFVKSGEYVFALSNNRLYRQDDANSDFVEIANIDANKSRDIVIFNDKIYITTDKGPQSTGSYDIYNDTNIVFTIVWPLINVNDAQIIITSLSVIDEFLYIGTDRKIFVINDIGDMWMQYEQKNTIVPSIYINKKLQKIGYYYNNNGQRHNVSFDESLGVDDIVEVSNKYNIYQSQFGGWASNKYNAKVYLKYNNDVYGESSDNYSINIEDFKNWTFPIVDDTTSYYSKSVTYQENVNNSIIELETSIENNEDNVSIIRDLIHNFELYKSVVYKNVQKAIDFPSLNNNIVNKVFDYYDTNGNIVYKEENLGSYYDSVNGLFYFDKSFSKDDNLAVDILGCTVDNVGDNTHREIEDNMELINSGSYSSLSRVQQVNLLKLNIFNKDKESGWGVSKHKKVTEKQMRTIIPSDTGWYDEINSTFNYELQINNEHQEGEIFYPSAVLYIEEINKVYVGDDHSIVSIDTESLNMEYLDIVQLNNDYKIKMFFRHNDDIYILTDYIILRSNNFGNSWEEVDRSGLPNNIYSISSVNNNIIIGAEDGLYYRTSEEFDWTQSYASTYPIEVMSNPDLLFVLIDKKIYYSNDGYNFTDMGLEEELNVNKIIKFNNRSTYISTDDGLYTDSGSFYSKNPKLIQVDSSEDLSINDIYTKGNEMIVGNEDGTYYILNNSELELQENSLLEAVHKVLIVDESFWLFGYDLLYITNIDFAIKISTGDPL